MYRVSTTTLESFRRVVRTEYGNEAELLASIRGEPFKPSWQMEAGTAFHGLLADPLLPSLLTAQDDDTAQEGDYRFRIGALRTAYQHFGPGLHEVKATKIIDGVRVVAQADHVHGLHIRDYKTKFSTADVRDYETSLQWRFYLLVHEAAAFTYDLFSFREPKGGLCEMTGVLSVRFWRYEALEADCRYWLGEFMAWAEGRRLLKYLDRPGSSITVEEAA